MAKGSTALTVTWHGRSSRHRWRRRAPPHSAAHLHISVVYRKLHGARHNLPPVVLVHQACRQVRQGQAGKQRGRRQQQQLSTESGHTSRGLVQQKAVQHGKQQPYGVAHLHWTALC